MKVSKITRQHEARLITLLLIAILLFTLIPIIPFPATSASALLLHWNIETVDKGDGVVGMHSSMVLDNNGNPHISYLDYTNGALKYAKWIGTSWEITTIDQEVDYYLKNGVATRTWATTWFTSSIAIDRNGFPHIVYIRIPPLTNLNYGFTFPPFELRYAKWNGTEWSIEVIKDGVVDHPQYPSLILDSNDYPHICYINGYYSNEIVYIRQDKYQPGWSKDVIPLDSSFPTNSVADAVSLALDSNNNPHVLIHNCSQYPEFVYHDSLIYATKILDEQGIEKSKILDEWSIEKLGNTTGRSFEISRASLALDTNNDPHIIISGKECKYAKKTHGIWKFETIEFMNNAYYQHGSLSLDNDNNPHIGYIADIPINNNYYPTLKYATLENGNWDVQIVDDEIDMCSFVLNNDNIPSISYYKNQDLIFTTWTGYEWISEVVDIGDGKVGKYSSLEIGINNNKHISYYDEKDEYHECLKYAKYSNGIWEANEIDDSISGYFFDDGFGTSITLDDEGKPYISYHFIGIYGYPRADIFKYVRWTGDVWEYKNIDDNIYYGGAFSSIALDSSNNVHISYLQREDKDLIYAKCIDNTWSIEVVDSEGWVGKYSSLVLDSSENPHICYYEELNGDLKYAKWDGSIWQTEIVDSGGKVGLFCSMDLDSNDYPHISYYGDNGDLKYAKWTGTEWHIDIIDSLSGTVWYQNAYTSIALDSDDNPHISYYDVLKGDLKYAYWGDEYQIIVTVDSEGVVGQYNSIALDNSNNPHISYFDSTNNDLKIASASIMYLAPTTTMVVSLEDLVILNMIKYGVLNNLKLALWQADWLEDHNITSGEFYELEDDPRSYSISHTCVTSSFNDRGLGYIGNLSVTNENDYPLNVTLNGLNGFIIKSTQNRTIQSILGVLHEVNDGVVSYIPSEWILLDARGGEKDTAIIVVQGFCIGPYNISPESGPLEIRPPSLVDTPDTLSSTQEIVEFTNSLDYPSSFTLLDTMLARSVIYFALTGQDVTPEKLGNTYSEHDIDAIVSFSRDSMMDIGIDPEGIPMFTYGTGKEEIPTETTPTPSIPSFPIPAVILSIAILVWMIRRQPQPK